MLCYIFRLSPWPITWQKQTNKDGTTSLFTIVNPAEWISLNYQCFEVHEKIKYGFITSIRKTKLFVIVKIDGDISSRKCSCVKVYSLLAMRVFGARATTAQKYPGRDTFEFDQGPRINQSQCSFWWAEVSVCNNGLCPWKCNPIIHLRNKEVNKHVNE